MQGKAVRILITVFLAVIIVFPVLYAISLSFFTPLDFTDTKAHFLPSAPAWQNYLKALASRYYARYAFNSFITALAISLLRLAVSILAAFSFSHLRFKGSMALMTLLLATLFIPQDALLYENYATIASMHLIDTYAAIILPSLFSASAMVMFYGACLSLGTEYYDAARIDGAGDLRYITRILVPLTKSIAVTLLLQTFISAFNSYLWPLIVTNSMQMRTLQVGIAMLGFADSGDMGAQFAAIVIMTVPFLLLLIPGRKIIAKALSEGIQEV